MNTETRLNHWLTKKTFWQLNVAFGLVFAGLFVMSKTASHYFLYHFQLARSELAVKLGLDSHFQILCVLIIFLGLALWLIMHYGNLAEKLKVNLLTLYALLLANIAILTFLTFDTIPPEWSPLFIFGFRSLLSLCIKTSLVIAMASFLLTLLWHYVIKPSPKLKGLVSSLLGAESENSQKAPTNHLGKWLAIAVVVGFICIVLGLVKKEVNRFIHMAQELYSHADEQSPIATCQQLHYLGNLAAQLGNYSAAEEMFRRALSIAETINSPGSNAKTTAIFDLADLLTKVGKSEEANQLYARIKIYVETP